MCLLASWSKRVCELLYLVERKLLVQFVIFNAACLTSIHAHSRPTNKLCSSGVDKNKQYYEMNY